MIRKKKSCLAVFALLVVLGLVGAEIAGRVVFSDQFREEARQELLAEWPGKSEMGPVSFSFLAGGTATYRDIVLYSPEKDGKEFVRIPELSVNVEVSEYLNGKYVIEDLHIDGLVLDVERLEDLTIAGLFHRLPDFLPHAPSLGATAWAQNAAVDPMAFGQLPRIVVNRFRLTDAKIQYTDHHGHDEPVLAELTPVNMEVHDLVFPREAGDPAANYRMTGTIPTESPGKLQVEGDVALLPTGPTFTVEWAFRDIQGPWLDQFIPEDLAETEIRGGTLDMEGGAVCDEEGHLTGEWAFEVFDVDVKIDEGLMERNVRETESLVRALGQNYRIKEIPIDCYIYDVAFEVQECFVDHLRMRLNEQYEEITGAVEKSQQNLQDLWDKMTGNQD